MVIAVGSYKWIVRVITRLWNKYYRYWTAVVVLHPRVDVDMPSGVIENERSPCRTVRIPPRCLGMKDDTRHMRRMRGFTDT